MQINALKMARSVDESAGQLMLETGKTKQFVITGLRPPAVLEIEELKIPPSFPQILSSFPNRPLKPAAKITLCPTVPRFR